MSEKQYPLHHDHGTVTISRDVFESMKTRTIAIWLEEELKKKRRNFHSFKACDRIAKEIK